MPYVQQCVREQYDELIDKLTLTLSHLNWEPGDVNYIFTRILRAWFTKKRKYATICYIMGTLICVAFEFYRRVAAGYEDTKIKENGDVQ